MKVKEIMLGTPHTCHKEANMGEAAELMWKGNCGFLAITGADEKVCGVIPDRDICMALATRNKPAGEITAGEVPPNLKLFACSADEEIHAALLTMRDGKAVGVLSMDDVLLHAEPCASGKIVELSTDEVVRRYRAIHQRQLPQRAKKQTAAA